MCGENSVKTILRYNRTSNTRVPSFLEAKSTVIPFFHAYQVPSPLDFAKWKDLATIVGFYWCIRAPLLWSKHVLALHRGVQKHTCPSHALTCICSLQ